MTRLALNVDLDRCTGCISCVVACQEEHGLSDHVSGIRLEQVGPEGRFPELRMYYLPVGCQHCDEPACFAACAAGALQIGEDGVTRVVAAECTACGSCVTACPYGAIGVEPVRQVAFKCDLCTTLRSAGGRPACVKACPGKALTVSVGGEAGHGERGFVLKPTAGTGPRGRYVLTRQVWKG